MHDGRKVLHGLAAVFAAAALLSNCSEIRDEGATKENKALMLEDENPTPAPHSLVRPQERPTFPVDENQRQYAMTEDREDKHGATDKPVSIREAEAQAQ